MSSGLTLLRQLQARQKLDSKACYYVGGRQKNSEASGAEVSEDNSTVEPLSTISAKTARSAKEERITIEVCLGPDCAVAGGGAALLEIEDLIRFSASSEKEINIVSGGCRDHCSEGPNVRLLSSVKGICDSEFSRVNCPDACRRIVRALDSSNETTNTKESVEVSPVSKLLKRKQDSRRWQEHRQIAAKDRRLQAKVRENSTRNS
mmetsp:Transcript_1151/g.2391  ORF Transcript_1151/g.2391 Transcript_1151/m.2391 type:complete len:205 (-) Transcript_1151:6-620(-)